jgi:glutamate dehydrogenase
MTSNKIRNIQPVEAEMIAQPFLDTEQQRGARRRIDEAETVLTGLYGGVPEGFAERMFGRGAPEDVVRYEGHEIAALAEQAWGFLKEREPGKAKVRMRPGDALRGERLKTLSVLEILNDNMPFLLDSIMGELNERGIELRLVVHPVFSVERDDRGALTGFYAEALPASAAVRRESYIHLHTERVDEEQQGEIVAALGEVLADVRVCVEDWRAMTSRVRDVVAEIRDHPPLLPVEELAEAIAFLEWLLADNFTFLGVRDYAFPGGAEVAPQFESGLGILRSREVRVLRRGREFVTITPEIMEFLAEPKVLIITKANVRARVHRRVHMDYIGVKRFDAGGRVTGEFRIVGLFTSSVYTRAPGTIPYLRRKVDAVIKRSGLDPAGHSGKALVNVLESYPRDELFQIDEDTLFHFVIEILYLDERPRVRVLARRDRFDRFVSVLAYVPRDRFDSSTRRRIGAFLAEIYRGTLVAFYPFFPEGPLVRVHFIVARFEGETPNPDRATLEQRVEAIVRTWTDALGEALTLVHGPVRAQALLKCYREAFPVSYREDYGSNVAIGDIRVLESLSASRPLGVEFYARRETGAAGLKVLSRERPIPLSDRVPVLENMGFRVVDERTYRIEPRSTSSREVWLHDMLLERHADRAIEIDALKQRLEACFLMVMRGRAENDGYNALVLAAGMPWREIALLRMISRFLRQVRIAFSQDYMWTTLRRHAGIAAKIVQLFNLRFDPRACAEHDAAQHAEILGEIDAALKTVESLDEDLILRRFVNAVQAAVRTNFYQMDPSGQPKETLALKFESRKLDGIPAPRPLYEIFVYSPRLEGVHLRFGKVARGGIRWSDRPQDFRTEVLGLVKAQQVKNAVIVPVGAKGGFVPKQLPVAGGREAMQAEGTAAYVLFISSLLEVTDNIGTEGVLPPANVMRHDGDDPYLVVAADKGTATFSDTANGIAIERKFWLGDAFASGGSAGYDHKKMGITARGAWEAVRRHFRETDVDIRNTPFTVAGVGDMSGDVFGNGMLLERTIRLVAAFDHRDIFLDPDPDPETSFVERKRLFDLPRSSWQDYDRTKLSEGGGVFPRTSKEIPLAPAVQQLLGLSSDHATPNQVLRGILRTNVDLLWFGGIGTYVRATTETDDQVGDRANDSIRIAAAELNAKVIGEGANLGMTQRARIEAAARGVRLNTDAIDNSAGVNTSDVEVNIKIAFLTPLREGRLSIERRNELLVEMTDEVAGLVLRNNYLQTLALSLAERRSLEDLGFQQRLMQTLESRGLLDRAVEFLPDDLELAERSRRKAALTRPELAVLLAYAKTTLYSDLLDTTVPDDPYLGRELFRYFPPPLREGFPEAVAVHRLRREIIATRLANAMINRGGPMLVVRIADQTGASAAQIAAAFAAARDSYQLDEINRLIDGHDNRLSGRLQLSLYAAVEDLLIDRLIWFLRNVDFSQGLAEVVEHYRAGIESFGRALDAVLGGPALSARAARAAELAAQGVDQDLALQLATLPAMSAATDAVLVAERTGKGVPEVAATYFAAGAYFELDRIAQAARAIRVSDYFDQLALDRALSSIAEAERLIAAQLVVDGSAGAAAVEAWVAANSGKVPRIRAAVREIAQSGLTLSKLSLAASLLGDLVK